MGVFRIYDPVECRADGYPYAWSVIDPLTVTAGEYEEISDRIGAHVVGIKDLVREDAGHRCIRCQHPYRVGVDGIFEPANLEVHRLARDLNVTARELELGLELDADNIGALTTLDLGKTRRTHWSGCDERCTHGGPLRIKHAGEWQQYGEADDATELLHLAGERQAAWRILTVHHLDGVKANCRWWNLVALCQRCHLQIQGKVQMARVWPWEHTDWFQPYVAGYYAWAYLGEDVPRDQADARLDELLALERAA
jgi:hypothetical protein